MMRLVCVADTHTFEEDLGALPYGDVLIHAGDMLRRGTLAELAPVAQWLRAQPHPHKIVVAGNHDRCFQDERDGARAALGPDIVYLEDSGVSLGGLSFWGSPWQPDYRDWAFNLPRGEALAARWRMIPPQIDVLITHGPPRGFGDRSPIAGRHGCDDLREAVLRARARLHLFGHIHQDGGCWLEGGTTLANVTTWECERAPSVFDVEPGGGRVIPVSVPPAGR